MIRSVFEKKLNDISAQIRQKPPSFTIYYWQGNDECSALVQQFETHLKLAGMLVTVQSLKGSCSLDSFMEETSKSSEKHHRYVIPKALQTELKNKQVENNLLISSLTFEECENSDSLIFLKENTKNALTPFYFSETFSTVSLGNGSTYYHSFIKILMHLLPENDFEDFLVKIQRHNGETGESIVSNSTQSYLPIQNTKSYFGNLKTEFLNILYQRKWQLRFLTSLLLIILSTTFLGGSIFSIKRSPIREASVRSDLPIPSKPTFLNRTDLIAEISNSFKDTPEIQTIAIIGPGGSGKTTLARQYARSQKSPIVWEINAETQESLRNSFENFAYALLKTDEEKKVMRELQGIKMAAEKDKKIIQLVKDSLKLRTGWLLIFDNVEKFSDIQKYFPSDPNVWGNGKVILTTRDSHIQNNSQIQLAIQVGELEPSEKLNFFLKIMNHSSGPSSSLSNKGEIEKFLNNIPSFPLDVSLAAHYLKATSTSYEEYLMLLKTSNNEFLEMQENVLKDSTNYTKTRYNIIATSLKKLTNANKDFSELLLFISLIGSQNIPRDLLHRCKEKTIVDNFIYHLKKYSLLTGEDSLSSQNNTFSLHRSTQAIILPYLLDALPLEKRNELLKRITRIFAYYIIDAVDKEEFLKLKYFVSHINVFLSFTNLINDEYKHIITSELGIIYYYENKFVIAKNYLENNIEYFNNLQNINHSRIVRLSIYLGSVYFNLGNYEKAKDYFERSVVISKKHLPKDYKLFSMALNSLGNFYKILGKYEESKKLLEESLAIYEKYLPQNFNDIASTLTNLGSLYAILGEHTKSIEFHQKSLDILEQNFPENHPAVPLALIHLGAVYRITGDYYTSKKLLERALRISKLHFSDNYNYIARTSCHLGNVYRKLGYYEKAKVLLEQSLKIYDQYSPDDYVGKSWPLAHLGILNYNIGNYDKAGDLLEKSLVLLKKHLPENHIEISWVLAHLGIVNREIGKLEISKSQLEKSLAIYKKCLPNNHVGIPWVMMHLANTYSKMGYHEKARILLEESVQLHKNIFKQDNIRLSWVSAQLGNIYLHLKNYEKAKALIEHSLENHQKYYQKTHPKIAWMNSRLKVVNKELELINNSQ
ncbi:MAG: tetratricopeptide repeat protein [Alphaproteobacteria bacterium]|nr:tetratricopeptide repeat protein [Alphaproteobacteria bacterium]